MIQPPEAFERSLKNYDPALSLRWGSAMKQWVIERAGTIRPTQAEYLHYAATRENPEPKAVEEWESARNGRHVIHYVKELDQRVHDFLWKHDIQKQGFKILNRFMTEQDRKKKAIRSRSEELARETVSIMGFISSKKSDKIRAGRADEEVRECLTGKKTPGQQYAVSVPKKLDLVDAYGRPLKPKTDVKIHLPS